MAIPQIEFGLGLISIGKSWGFHPSALPNDGAIHRLLKTAVRLGIRILDTAPSYGASEEHVGRFLRTLEPQALDGLVVSTKCGEHWDAAKSAPFVDHSYDALCRSIDRSLERLPRISLLQIHKTTRPVIESRDLERALDYARARGITAFGASVTDLATARAVCESPRFSMIQIPLNSKVNHLEDALALARDHGKQVWTNRPFAMGELLYGDVPRREAAVAAYRYVLGKGFCGAILTGAGSAAHLEEDLEAFRAALLGCV